MVNTLPVVSQVTTKLCDDHLPYTIGQQDVGYGIRNLILGMLVIISIIIYK